MRTKQLSLFLAFSLTAGVVLGQAPVEYQWESEPQPLPGANASGSGGQGTADRLSDFYLELEQLRQEVQSLRGLVEEQMNTAALRAEQERERYIDLDRRLSELNRRLESAPPVNPVPAGGTMAEPGATPGDSQAAKAAYRNAYALVANKEFDKAADEFFDFIDKYPDSPLVANAYYWLGEVYLVQSQLEPARNAFTVVVKQYPDHRKAPDAAFKLGLVAHRQEKNDEARRILESVIKDYPGSTAASLAQTYLKQL